MSRKSIQFITIFAVLTLILVACGGSDEPQQPAAPPAPAVQEPAPNVPVGTDIGERAPDFTLKDLQGNAISLADYRGRPVLLNFMHTWCVPCNNSAPRMNAAYEANQDKGFVILSVDVQEPPSATQAFIDKYDLKYPFVLDPDGKVLQLYGARGMPISYFLDANGVIQAVRPGELTREWIESTLAKVSG